MDAASLDEFRALAAQCVQAGDAELEQAFGERVGIPLQRFCAMDQVQQVEYLQGLQDGSVQRPNPQVHTSQFKAWFGDSKVVDAYGRPLVVYHGTTGDFTVFNTASCGAFFTSSEQIARTYGVPIPVYLSFKNPVVIDAQWSFWNELDLVSSESLDGLRKYGRIVVLDHIKSVAEKAGYDGAIVRNVVDNGGCGDQFIAFRSEQIKSAIGNSGKFDLNNPEFTDGAGRYFLNQAEQSKARHVECESPALGV